MKQVWAGKHLHNLLNLPIKELEILYPDYTKGTLKGKKAYWLKQLKEGKIKMPPRPESEPAPQTGKLVRTWETARGTQEDTWDVITLHSYDHTKQQLSDFISQADPVRITPSKRKPVQRDHKLVFAFSDSQIDYRNIDGELRPIHDERALEVVRLMCADLQPDTIVNLGDTMDLAALSRFDKDSDHFQSLQPAINRVHRLYAELRADNPRARIVEVDSNHNTRLKKFMMKNAPNLYGVRQAGSTEEYPVFTYPFLTNLGAVGVEFISGYGAAEFVYGEEYDAPPIVFKHGMSTGKNVAQKEVQENPETHVVRGHTHRPETAHRTMRNGHFLTYMIVGVTCSIDGDVPSYHSAVDDKGQVVKHTEQWQQGVAVIRDYQDGVYEFNHVLINKGVAKYNGRVYSGTTV